jgi:polyhydroxybutyrate depolymerase
VKEKGILAAAAFGLIPLYLAILAAARHPDPYVQEIGLEHGGLQRRYLLHIPPNLDPAQPAALVLCLHGGGTTGDSMQGFTGFNRLSMEKGFLVAYPDAVGRNWNDGRGDRKGRSHRENVDDVGFLAAVIDDVARRHAVDSNRVFATGPSNGGFMSHRLGLELSERIAAIAPVIGGIGKPLSADFRPAQPVSVMIVQGTEDPLVPYAGGTVGLFQGDDRGRLIHTEEAVRRWVAANGCAEEPVLEELPDADPEDGCRVRVIRHEGGRGGTEVVLYRVEGGGHTWPGGRQYLPERRIGRVCRDFDATLAIWEFFERNPRR